MLLLLMLVGCCYTKHVRQFPFCSCIFETSATAVQHTYKLVGFVAVVFCCSFVPHAHVFCSEGGERGWFTNAGRGWTCRVNNTTFALCLLLP